MWGGGEKFATLLNDTCVHRVLFRDEPTAAGNRLVADTLMTLQDLATARVPLCGGRRERGARRVRSHRRARPRSDRAGAACDRLAKASMPPSDAAMQVVRRGGLRLVGRTGYPKEKSRDDAPFDRGASRFDRGARSFEPGAGQDRKAGDWDCPDCGFMNFASRSECFKCGAGGRLRFRSAPALRQPRRENRDGVDLRPGDWKCPLLRLRQLRLALGVQAVRRARRERRRRRRPVRRRRMGPRRRRRAFGPTRAASGAGTTAGSTAPPAGTGGTGAARRAAAGTDAGGRGRGGGRGGGGAAAESAAEDVATTLAAAAAAAAGTTARTMGSGRIDVLTY